MTELAAPHSPAPLPGPAPDRSAAPALASELLPKIVTVLREGYHLADLRADAMAGLTVVIVALPLSMAIPVASGVGPERGLFTSIIGGFLVSLLGALPRGLGQSVTPSAAGPRLLAQPASGKREIPVPNLGLARNVRLRHCGLCHAVCRGILKKKLWLQTCQSCDRLEPANRMTARRCRGSRGSARQTREGYHARSCTHGLHRHC